MKLTFTLILAIFLFSCTGQKKQPQEELLPEKELTKLEQLMLLPKDSVIKFYDLSNDSILEFPNLSDYTIKSLDLSHNLIDTTLTAYLPKEIEKLDLSYNLLNNIFDFQFELDSAQEDTLKGMVKLNALDKINRSHSIKEINISHNNITFLGIKPDLEKIIATHNDLKVIQFSHRKIKYIDISDNPNLSNVVGFDPYVIDTVISNNIANNKRLVWAGYIYDM